MIKFGTDGWRAVIADEFTFANVRIVAQAIADFVKMRIKKTRKVVIGYDSRFLSGEFAKEVACVCAANNIKATVSSECVPTPLVSFHTRYSGYSLGIMITASHNPGQFNGLKIKTKDGGAADKQLTNQVEQLLYKRKPKYLTFESALKKKLIRQRELHSKYEAFLSTFVSLRRIRKLKLKVLIDTMYGSGKEYARNIIRTNTIRIDYLRNEYNPSFGGIHPEPVAKNLSLLIGRVRKEKYDFGIALDGDADRVAAVTSSGTFIDAQVLLPLLAIHMVKNRAERMGIGKTVVGSNLIDAVALSLGVPCYETPVGFKYISNLFKEKLIAIGGEEAGGIGFKGYIPERDGTASFLMLLEMMAYEKKSFDRLLKELWKQFGRWHYLRTAVPVKSLRKTLAALKIPKALLGKNIERINTSDGVKLITKNSWLMFRKSGTEPIIRVYAESRSRRETNALLEVGTKLVKTL